MCVWKVVGLQSSDLWQTCLGCTPPLAKYKLDIRNGWKFTSCWFWFDPKVLLCMCPWTVCWEKIEFPVKSCMDSPSHILDMWTSHQPSLVWHRLPTQDVPAQWPLTTHKGLSLCYFLLWRCLTSYRVYLICIPVWISVLAILPDLFLFPPQPSWSQRHDAVRLEGAGGRKEQRTRCKRRGAVRPVLLFLTGKKIIPILSKNEAMGQRAKVGQRSNCSFRKSFGRHLYHC